MSDDNNERYNDILKRIAQRKPFGQPEADKKPTSAYDLILDSLNAYDTIDRLAHRAYKTHIVHGAVIRRYKTWSGVMLWYRPTGYHGYKTLSVFGVWAHQIGTDLTLSIGIRQLPYRMAFYNAEGYFKTIQKDFKLFYEDSGTPPTPNDTLLFRAVHQTKERLTYRQTLAQITNRWYADITRN